MTHYFQLCPPSLACSPYRPTKKLKKHTKKVNTLAYTLALCLQVCILFSIFSWCVSLADMIADYYPKLNIVRNVNLLAHT